MPGFGGEIKNKVGDVASDWVVHLPGIMDFLEDQNRTTGNPRGL